jgi:hypothetical protein
VSCDTRSSYCKQGHDCAVDSSSTYSQHDNVVLTIPIAMLLCCAGAAFNEQGFESVMEYFHTGAAEGVTVRRSDLISYKQHC